ncbi:gluconate 2-dehydrogenase subunit 3 family protein [Halomonas sp. BM-2019]|uniref:gluconate 2-dehydrogenase subunit 3 family protein n=1 Tax=Halomonas sp. BM-2019 TaxID=2811227 RepID=UPI001B3C2BC9|nr:MAG: gluconate 2-dehydrogenase subunit 3 family protein [Halomonas sp. BM-2019]
MIASNRMTLSRRRFLTLTGTLTAGSLALSATGLWPRWALADPDLASRLLRVGRDIYPHESIADRDYLESLTALLEKERDEIASGLDDLDRRARAAHGSAYAGIANDAEREALLREIQHTPFFAKVKSNLLMGIYNNPDLWTEFGYGGSSWEKGGYLHRGFDAEPDWL